MFRYNYAFVQMQGVQQVDDGGKEKVPVRFSLIFQCDRSPGSVDGIVLCLIS